MQHLNKHKTKPTDGKEQKMSAPEEMKKELSASEEMTDTKLKEGELSDEAVKDAAGGIGKPYHPFRPSQEPTEVGMKIP